MTLAEEIEARQGKRASVMTNDRWILVESVSGRGLLGSDPESFNCILDANSSPENLGNAVRSALDASRFLSAEDARQFLANVKDHRDALVEHLLRSTGIQSRRSLFKDMRLCNVTLVNESITFSPTVRERAEAWEGLGADTEQVVSLLVTDHDLGAALATSLGNCK